MAKKYTYYKKVLDVEHMMSAKEIGELLRISELVVTESIKDLCHNDACFRDVPKLYCKTEYVFCRVYPEYIWRAALDIEEL